MDSIETGLVKGKKPKQSCFVTIYQRIGKFCRRLRKRIVKSNVVSPMKGEQMPELQRFWKPQIFESFDIVKKDDELEASRNYQEDDDVIIRREGNELSKDENDDYEEDSQHSEAFEQETDKLADDMAQETLQKITAKFLDSSETQEEPGIEEDEDKNSLDMYDDLREKIETIVFSDDEDFQW